MPGRSYRSTAIPEKMYRKIEELMKNDYVKSKYAFSSVLEFVHRALSECIDKLKREIREEEKWSKK
ncbi:MAG: hypothetical protein ACTSR0_06410 [Candidatus Asgardarchaeia archaeon]